MATLRLDEIAGRTGGRILQGSPDLAFGAFGLGALGFIRRRRA